VRPREPVSHSPAAALSRRALLTGAPALAAAASCATFAPAFRTGTPIYVPPFVDTTKDMAVGFLLTRVVQEAVYSRAPRRFVVVFDDAVVAVDGSVAFVRDVDVDADRRDVVVGARATLVDKRGVVRHDIGLVERAGRYAVSTSTPADTEARRARALQVATVTVGGALADLLLEMP
jgi:hypothetical protein